MQANGGFVPGIVPIVTRMVPSTFTTELMRHSFTGAEPEGPYKWLTALTHPGTLDFIGEVGVKAFAFSRQRVTRNEERRWDRRSVPAEPA